MASQVIKCVREVLRVEGVLGLFITSHAGIEERCQFEVGIGFEDTVEDKIPNLWGDFAVLVEQEILESELHVSHVCLQVHHFAEGSWSRLVEESVCRKQRRWVGTISQRYRQRLSCRYITLRVNSASVIIVLDIKIWARVVIEIINNWSNSSARRGQRIRTCDGNIKSPFDELLVRNGLFVEWGGKESFLEVNEVGSFFHRKPSSVWRECVEACIGHRHTIGI
mmetsp:Transcript_26056/g.58058  ORF Transcript_26056/g.58058 Transcript_26056/m.58058 type:complete len:223 (+) Transcript_26056:408-1076(+)